jgi:hypothetical protein
LPVEIVIDEWDDGVGLGRIVGDGFSLEVDAEVNWNDRQMILRRLDVYGIEGISANDLGPYRLRQIITDTMEALDVDELIIEGSIRVAGANPGRKPGRLRFTRKTSPSVPTKP